MLKGKKYKRELCPYRIYNVFIIKIFSLRPTPRFGLDLVFLSNNKYKHAKRQNLQKNEMHGRKYPASNFAKCLFLEVWSLGKSEILRKLHWKIWSVWYFFLLENLMCSNEILDKISWNFWCVLVRFASPGKFTYVRTYVPFLVLLENSCFLITSKPPGKFNMF